MDVVPVLLGPSGDGWLACWKVDGKLVSVPVVVWAICRKMFYDEKTRKIRAHWSDNDVFGLVAVESGIEVPQNYTSDEEEFLGYMRRGESVQDQDWWARFESEPEAASTGAVESSESET